MSRLQGHGSMALINLLIAGLNLGWLDPIAWVGWVWLAFATFRAALWLAEAASTDAQTTAGPEAPA